ncbi:gluconate 5-dehydrogenase [Thioclava dalianensis]|uniref:Gluconate 5-dehydrogenase n=1 Tax=Thioclava dalianensis TaxID=1185766 RepID=A0A074TH03_9RHOB|nr:SDR family oxidoreductase [Thioclava dalianensis]KEP69425.1 gluconate 5-dehydrogenase [Thioclava dalianensis]SFN02965.1 gluconate 5-dehydrogenase [Thioclava dalianensis]
MSTFDLTGKTALVTGSSRGLGRTFAEALCAAGAHVVLNGVNADRLAQTRDEMAAQGYAVSAAAFDVSDEAAVRGAFDRLDAQGHSPDILVNNAGIQLRRPMLELSAADWQRVMDTNLTSAFLCGREAASRMIAKGGGKIINIGSLMSDLARATVAPYTVAKGGIKMLTRSMAAEWAGSNIQANAIGPGYMMTDMTQPLQDDVKFDSWVRGRTPAGRWGRPEELQGAVVFLASAASDFVNGQILYIDGGMTAVL